MCKPAEAGWFRGGTCRLSGANGWMLAVGAVLLCGLAALLPPGAVWITDNGNKYMILRNFAEHGTVAMQNPAADIDPDNRFFPDGFFHFQRHNGRIYSIYPEFFSILTLPFYLLLGEAGLWVLPIGGTLAVLALFLALLKPWRLSWRLEAILAAVLLCGTPLCFYAATFWEMTPAVAVATAALVALLCRRYLLAGLLLGIGLWLREEFYLVAFAAGVAVLSYAPERWRAAWRIVGGGIGPILLLWWYQLSHYGHILGLHGSLYYTHNSAASSGETPWLVGLWEGYRIYLLQFDALPESWPGVLMLLCLAPMAGMLITGAFRGGRAWKSGLLIAAVVAWAVLFLSLWTMPQPVLRSGLCIGFVTSSPLFAGFFLNWRTLLTDARQPVRALAAGCLLYCLLLPPLLTRSDIGIIWGARHFLFVCPPLILLSFIGFSRMGLLTRARRWLVVTVILLGVLLQGAGIRNQFLAAEESAAAGSAIAAQRPEVVISDAFFLPEQTPRLFFEKKWLFVKDDADLDAALQLLQENGVAEFILVTSPGFGTLSPASVSILERNGALPEGLLGLDAPGSGFMRLFILICRLQ